MSVGNLKTLRDWDAYVQKTGDAIVDEIRAEVDYRRHSSYARDVRSYTDAAGVLERMLAAVEYVKVTRSTFESADARERVYDLHAAGIPFPAISKEVVTSCYDAELLARKYWDVGSEDFMNIIDSVAAFEKQAALDDLFDKETLRSGVFLDVDPDSDEAQRLLVGAAVWREISQTYFNGERLEGWSSWQAQSLLEDVSGNGRDLMLRAVELYLSSSNDSSMTGFARSVRKLGHWLRDIEPAVAVRPLEEMRPSHLRPVVEEGHIWLVSNALEEMNRIGVVSDDMESTLQGMVKYARLFTNDEGAAPVAEQEEVVDFFYMNQADSATHSPAVTPANMRMFVDYCNDKPTHKAGYDTNKNIIALLGAGVPYRIIRSCANGVLSAYWEEGVLAGLLREFTPAVINRYMGMHGMFKATPGDIRTLQEHGVENAEREQTRMRWVGANSLQEYVQKLRSLQQ